MKRFYLLFFAFIFGLNTILIPPTAFAQDQPRNIILEKNRTINEDYFAAGDTVTVLGNVNGDIYVAGGNVIIDTTVNGDVIVAGGNVTVRGTAQNVRAAGGQVTISGTVEKNLTAMGGNITLSDQAQLKGSMVSAGGTIILNAPVGKGATLAGGNITVGETVDGNMNAATGNLVLLPQAKINGNLQYTSEKKADIAQDASVSGKITQHIPVQEEQKGETAMGIGIGLMVLKIIDLLAILILGLLLVLLVPNYLKSVSKNITIKTWVSLGIGFVALIIGPFIFVLLLMTIIGIPLAFIFLCLYFIAVYFAKILAIYFIGDKISDTFDNKLQMGVIFILGFIIYAILSIIPVIGVIADFLLLLLGLGGMLLQKRTIYTTLRKQKTI